MDRKRIGWALAALGAALFVVSAGADAFGIGNDDGIGWKQTVGMIAGAAVLAVGLFVAMRGRAGSGSAGV